MNRKIVTPFTLTSDASPIWFFESTSSTILRYSLMISKWPLDFSLLVTAVTVPVHGRGATRAPRGLLLFMDGVDCQNWDGRSLVCAAC